MRHHTGPVRARTSPQRSVTRPPVHRTQSRSDADPRRCPDGVQRLTVEVRRDLPRTRIEVTGELDLDSASLLTAMLHHVRSSRRRTRGAVEVDVEVDLAGVTFADSHGMAPLLDERIRIVTASRPVRRLLRLLDGPWPAAWPGLPEAHPRPA